MILFIVKLDSTGNKSASTHIVIPGQKPQRAPFNGMTTAMADFVKHPLTARQSICKPPASSTHYDLGPFDGRTTQSMAYQAWPVAPFAKPSWAIKPKYKRPKGGMPYASTYMVNIYDFPKHSRYLPFYLSVFTVFSLWLSFRLIL